MKSFSYCASFQRVYRRVGLSAALLLVAGSAYGQDNLPLLADPVVSVHESQVPYLIESSTRHETVGINWMPFDSLLFDVKTRPFGSHGNGTLSLLSGTWLGPQSIAVNAYAAGTRLPPTSWNAFGYCASLVSLAPGCLSSWEATRLNDTQAFNYGLRTQWQPLDGFSLGLGYHHRNASGQAAQLLMPGALDFLAPGWNAGLSVPGTRSAEGVDLDMAYGFDAGFIGEVEFELRLSHELNRSLQLDGNRLLENRSWRQDPLSHASFGFNWNRGDFSGSLSSRYVDSIFLNGQPEPASWTSLDINFAWRTPWNGSLSVGAKNLLGNEPPMTELNSDSPLPPGLNEAFSSIPYVRYEQDL